MIEAHFVLQAVRDCHSRFSNYQKIREKIERHAEGQSDKYVNQGI